MLKELALSRLRFTFVTITMSPKRVGVQNLVGIDSADTDMLMRENTRFVWIFLLSAYLSVSSWWLQVTVLGRF